MAKVPRKTSIYEVEPVPDKYVIPFAPELVQFLESGEKVETYRYGDKYEYLEVGDLVVIQNNKTKEGVFNANIVEKKKTTFASLPLTSSGHEGYESKDQQRAVFSGYYAYLGRPIENDDPFLIFTFRRKEAISEEK